MVLHKGFFAFLVVFGPTFANLNQLSEENAIVINEGDYMGRIFFLDLYRRLGLNVHEYSFDEHDEAMAYSLSVPFVSTFVFSAVMMVLVLLMCFIRGVNISIEFKGGTHAYNCWLPHLYNCLRVFFK